MPDRLYYHISKWCLVALHCMFGLACGRMHGKQYDVLISLQELHYLFVTPVTKYLWPPIWVQHAYLTSEIFYLVILYKVVGWTYINTTSSCLFFIYRVLVKKNELAIENRGVIRIEDVTRTSSIVEVRSLKRKVYSLREVGYGGDTQYDSSPRCRRFRD
jgi:hypothetical protein